jgi:mannose-1-phosphate guanylyltransferase / phosphomannomutase
LESVNASPSEKIFLLAGGLGTRSANPALPKVLQLVSSNPEISLLDQHLMNFDAADFLDISALLRFGASTITGALEASPYTELGQKLQIVEDSDSAVGTSSALVEAVAGIGFGDFNALVLGDTLIGAPLRHYMALFRKSGADLGLAVHPNLHISDSDRVVLDVNGNVSSFIAKGHPAANAHALAWPVTGLILFTSNVAKKLKRYTGDATRDLYETAMRSGLRVIALNFSHYSGDVGTEERLAKARSDVASGAFNRRSATLRAAIFIDRDGTLIKDEGSGRADLDEQEHVEGIQEIRQANQMGIPVFLVTNQPGVAKGQILDDDVNRVHSKIQARLISSGAFIDDFIYCPHHPEAGHEGEVRRLKIVCDCRKPNPGMLIELRNRHGLNLEKSFFIGDTSADRECAEAGQVSFRLGKWGTAQDSTSDAIAHALRELESYDHN